MLRKTTRERTTVGLEYYMTREETRVYTESMSVLKKGGYK
uniref:Uncharacterized protein n=1 Tax=Candidatus Kentrum sp. MB TaxID=2138164 RepID=A0A451BDQ0_9GAMM|nr:MAG: hypothetical protein BECKMB1821I_GA0114274_105816 [Candidatus Kentron sp. MB]VFK76412.1 MAG: hypothetical protein BECKMB1821H_GA0114242_105516 [Candidatus Kentron sp. MB]